jgi:hypothetical protein
MACLAVSVGLRSSVHIQLTGNCTKIYCLYSHRRRVEYYDDEELPEYFVVHMFCISQQTGLLKTLGQKIHAAQVL